MTIPQKNVALVTGAGARIGKELALALAADGWAVAVHYRVSEGPAREVSEHIIRHGGHAAIFHGDLANEEATAALLPAVARELGPVTCLINNASVFEHDSVESATRGSWDLHLDVNLRAPFVLSQVMARNLPRAASGSIVNIIDQRVENLTPHFMSYTISKSALWTITQTLAQALAPAIRVNAISPGPVLPSPRQSNDAFAQQYAATPLERAVGTAEICAAAKFILAAPSLTGQMITIDSGQHLGWSQAPKSGGPSE